VVRGPILAAALLAAAPAAADPTLGPWLTEDRRGVIELARCDDAAGPRLCGRLAWTADPADAPIPRDGRNPDPALRDRPLCGATLFYDFRPGPDGAWIDGRIYNPEDGEVYRATIRADGDGRLVLRGYVLVPLLGRSQTWTRVTEPPPPCRGG
jgi:uncharacterized protein (DUF2147 family)